MRNFFEHTRNPQGLGGKIMVSMMNRGHASVARWGMQHLELKDGSLVLDAGCGGGANMAAMRKRFSGGLVIGLDHSPVSADKAEKVNRRAVASGLCRVMVGDVASLPFPDSAFDLVTAFETVYFWPDPEQSFRQMLRVLKPGGCFLICNEADGSDPAQEKWCAIIKGMKIYTAGQLERFLRSAGFCQVRTDRVSRRNWLCVTAKKPWQTPG